jgi:succinate dehydrogenase/fumarate reductase-like Fe-S protein
MSKINNVVIVFGQSSQRYRPFSIKKDSKVEEYGFTPHLITIDCLQYINNQEVVVFTKKCGMNGCGVDIQFTNTEKSMYRIWDINEDFDWMSLKTFYELTHFKDSDYYVYDK